MTKRTRVSWKFKKRGTASYMKGFFFFCFKAFTFPFLIVKFFFFTSSNRWLRLKILFTIINLDHPLVSWKLKKRGSWNKFVYCIARCQEKVRKPSCSVIYFHSLVSWKLQKRGTAYTHEKALFSKRSHAFPNVLGWKAEDPWYFYIAVVKQMPNANSQFLYTHPLSL